MLGPGRNRLWLIGILLIPAIYLVIKTLRTSDEMRMRTGGADAKFTERNHIIALQESAERQRNENRMIDEMQMQQSMSNVQRPPPMSSRVTTRPTDRKQSELYAPPQVRAPKENEYYLPDPPETATIPGRQVPPPSTPPTLEEYRAAVARFLHPDRNSQVKTDNAKVYGGMSERDLWVDAHIPWEPPAATTEWLRHNCGKQSKYYRWGPVPYSRMRSSIRDDSSDDEDRGDTIDVSHRRWPTDKEMRRLASVDEDFPDAATRPPPYPHLTAPWFKVDPNKRNLTYPDEPPTYIESDLPTAVPQGVPRVKRPIVLVVSYYGGNRCWMLRMSQRYHVVVLVVSNTTTGKQIVPPAEHGDGRWVAGAFPPTYREVYLRNTGKGEEKNYVRYFRDNHDSLPPWSAVTQGEPYTHMPRRKDAGILDGSLQAVEAKVNRDTWISHHQTPSYSTEYALNRVPVFDPKASFQTLGGGRYRNFVCERMQGNLSRWRMAQIPMVRHIYDALGLPQPDPATNICHLAVCCQAFAVSAAAVRAYPPSVYQKLFEMRQTKIIHWNDIEFTWHLMFGDAPVSSGLVENLWISNDPTHPTGPWDEMKRLIPDQGQTCTTFDHNHTVHCSEWAHAKVHPVNKLGLGVIPDDDVF